MPFIGVEVKGSKRWIDLFFLPRFQPIEVLKPFLIIILATIFCDIRSNILLKYLISIIFIYIAKNNLAYVYESNSLDDNIEKNEEK